MRQVLLLHTDHGFQELVRSSLSEGFGCWTLPDWGSLRETARTASPCDLVIVDPLAGRCDGEPSPELRDFLALHRWLPVVAVVRDRPGSDSFHLLSTLIRWGVSEVILQGVEDTPDGVGKAVRAAQGKLLAGLMEEVLPPHLPGRVRRLLFAAAEAAAAGGHSPDLAALLGVTETTVIRRCERLRLPPPRRILAWVRVLMAARLLEDPDRTAQSVAYACGYATEAGLRRVVRSFLGTSVTELRRRCALETAATAFLAELRERNARFHDPLPRCVRP
ncbi:MAG TPA: helix-turn-helix domain-containing protein [Longimicrobiaceae bacterium]|nr:helix-turn-helix domain-containing protein [Longimicrobiaceae bacterium]